MGSFAQKKKKGEVLSVDLQNCVINFFYDDEFSNLCSG